MKYSTHHYEWKWDFKNPPETLWPWVSDTNRFDLDAGLPAVLEKHQELKGYLRQLQTRLYFLALEWEEEPFEWERNRCYGVVRRYRKGPIREMKMHMSLEPLTTGGSRMHYTVDLTPANLLGRLMLPLQLILIPITFEKTFRRYDERLLRGARRPVNQWKGRLSSEAEDRLQEMKRQLVLRQNSTDQVERLVDVIRLEDDLSLVKMRPYQYADHWEQNRLEILKLFLHATRVGLLDFKWELLCPLCRGAKETVSHLSDMKQQVHCDYCKIDFEVEFDRSVEVTFTPNASIRKVEQFEYCVGGPQRTPHILLQQWLQPGEKRDVLAVLDTGGHRIRIQGCEGGCPLQVETTGAADLDLQITAKGLDRSTLSASNRIQIHIQNTTDTPQLLIVERMAWSDQSVTAAEVTTIQLFRDLFSQEALRPGEQISVGSLAILFTDLTQSTRLYRRMGDAPAFGCVMSHFDLIKTSIDREKGALVKTIGDAVMAVFHDPASALRALHDAQNQLNSTLIHGQQLNLKAGLHFGTCIAVNLNDRLDYFGSTVNLAARLVSLSRGRDIVMTEALQNDPGVQRVLKNLGAGLDIERMEVKLKGLEEEKLEIRRIQFL